MANLELLLRAGTHAWRDRDRALEELLRADASMLAVDLGSFWRFRDEPPGIVCELGYMSDRHLFERGADVVEEDHAAYLTEARRVQIIRIDDARTDLRAGGLERYLERTGVGARSTCRSSRTANRSASSATSTSAARGSGRCGSRSSPSGWPSG